jgi:type IX secretion system PorP/SprF family membrane protein
MRYTMRMIGMLMLAVTVWQGHAQDLHFSQYFHSPLLVNPANTGFNPDYDFRLGANYRDQWANVGVPYRTMSAWGDTKLFANRFENGWMGLGGVLYKDMSGSGNLTRTSAYLSMAYHQMIGYSSLLSGGFSLGYTNKRIDVSKLTFDDQWNGKFFDVSVPTSEPFTNTQSSYLDLSLGLNYAYFASENFYFNAGISLMHINTPREIFYDPSVTDYRVPMRITGFLNSNIKVQDTWIVNPNLYVSKMGNAWETVLGFNANRDLNGDGSKQLILGMYYRNNDALIPLAGYEVNDLRITFNYDATISSLSPQNATRGAYEISIVKNGIFSSSAGRSVRCPTVRF